jgi:methyl-accepting chemotaxis protein
MSRLVNVFRNLKIGVKLAVTSILSILLIAALAIVQMTGGASVTAANNAAAAQQEAARDVMAAKAAIRAVQVGVRELRLARSPAELRNASDNIKSAHQIGQRYIEALNDKNLSSEVKEQLAQIDKLVGEYVKRTQEITTKKTEIFGADKKAAAENMTPSEAAAYVSELNEEIFRMVRLRMSAMANDIDSLIDKVDEAASQQAAEQRQQATEISQKVNLTVIGLASVAVILSILSALMAFLTIAKPMRALTDGMHELAGGNFDVVLPGLGRKDEIGDVAQAVEEFKVASAEKARAEAAANADRELQEAAKAAERDRIAAEERVEQERAAAAARDTALAKVMDEFDAAVGGIAKAALSGDFSQRVPLEGKDGVILNLAETMNDMCENTGAVLEELVGMLGAMAEGDLSHRIDSDYQGTFAILKDSANLTAQRLSQTVAEIKTSAGEVSSAAAEISASTSDLSQRTEEQAASLEETSASMEEISVTVRKNAESAQQANALTTGTRQVADRGGVVVADAVGAMSRIEESSRKIADIIGVIDEIARQTNLLALNAAVEAARAGDAGRGFAVVAAEVRSLAQRSSQAAKDIKGLIGSSTMQVKEGVDLVNKAGASLNEIVDSIKRVSEIVAGIATASAEQATGLDQVNKALAQMDTVTQQNSALVEENAATAKTLEQQATGMDERVSMFRIDRRSPNAAAAAGVPGMAQKKPAAQKAAPAAAPTPRMPARSGGPVGSIQAGLATALKADHEFEEF